MPVPRSAAAKRPFVVTLVAILQFIKAAFFFLAAYFLTFDPLILHRIGYDVSWVIAIVSADGSAMVGTAVDLLYGNNPQHLETTPVKLALLLMGFWLIYLGRGLLQLQAWARKSRIAFSVLQIAAALWSLQIYLPDPDSEIARPHFTAPQGQTLFILIVLNLAVAFYFLLDVHVVDAFRKSDARTIR